MPFTYFAAATLRDTGQSRKSTQMAMSPPSLKSAPRIVYMSILAAAAPQVSMGGNEILEEVHDGKTYLFFFTFRGILDSYAGFLFVPTGGDPRAFSDLNEAPATFITRYSEHWFFASHH
jgi:hypothetical protein